jgi:sterol desaturase/sphingolipid hydroxylase (fatty acid hydroxylase superfamily)
MFVATSLLPHEGTLRSSFFLLAFGAFAIWETFRPRRALSTAMPRRWAKHAVLWFLSSASAGLIYRVSAVLVAAAASSSRYGLLNGDRLPLWLRCLLAVLLLDLIRYGQHLLYHKAFWLWRIHQVHHADPDFDWSTGLRFHPVEVLFSQGIYLAVIAAVAPPPVAVLALELVESAVNFFVHANVALPAALESRLRWLMVTGDIHRIHHSTEIAEQNANFGVVFSFWDRLFGTYVPEPAAGQDNIVLGLSEIARKRDLSLSSLLLLPFRRAS